MKGQGLSIWSRRSTYAWISLGALLGVTTAIVYCGSRVPTYSATAEVYVAVDAGDSAVDLNQGSTFTQQVIKSYASVAVAPIVLDPVIEHLGLETNATELGNSITMTPLTGTSVIQIEYEGVDRKGVARVANSVAQELTSIAPQLSSGAKDSAIRLTVIRKATTPNSTASPNWILSLILGGVAGGLTAIACIAMSRRFDSRLRSVEGVEHFTSLPIVAEIPYDKSVREPLGLDQRGDVSPFAREVRMLRTKLKFMSPDRPIRILSVTSSVPGEGKSTLSVELAVATAASGTRVIVVDADLRRGEVGRRLGMDGSVGLSDVLVKSVRLQDAIQVWGADGLSVLPVGTSAPNPSELVESEAMASLLVELSESFDLVVLDTPPLLAVSESAVLSARSDFVLLLVGMRRGTRLAVGKSLVILEQFGVNSLGVVASMVRKPVTMAGYYYSYQHNPSRRATELAPEVPSDEVTAEVGNT